ncbi:MAG: DUF4292 domain-containing protein [Amoebophilaceae bacterium]|jgi:hypothetical protein|nr:DUF4292 domain-containing protein [Amoebophilaceae bacterium]
MPQKIPIHDECLVQPLDFEYLKIGATIEYQDLTHQHSSAYVKFRIQKDHLIWFSVLGLWGMEILRGVVTPTSITLLNRVQKTYTVYDYATLCILWPGPWDYALLQALLLGELAHPHAPQDLIQRGAQGVVIQQKKAKWLLAYHIHPALQKIDRLVVKAKQGSMMATYQQFKPYIGGLLCMQATMTWYCHAVPAQPAITLALKGIQAQWSQKPLCFPFSIPARYEKK